MVGFTPRDSEPLSRTEYALAGAISGSFARVVSQPLDVLKIRFQLQLEPISKKADGARYYGMWQAMRTIIRDEGWQALWKGHVPAQALSILYGMVQYSSFEVLTKAAWLALPPEMTTTEWRPLTHTFCGGMSGCFACFCIHPIDVLRTRFVAQGEPKIYTGLVDACRQMLAHEGAPGFYKGLTPALIQIFPQMGLQFGFYSLFTGLWNKAKGLWFDSVPNSLESLVCGSVSGVASKICVYPLDVVKKRLQVQGFEYGQAHMRSTGRNLGLVSCLVSVGRKEGLSGLYKGLAPGLVKAGVVAGVNFCTYEQIGWVFHQWKYSNRSV